MGQSLKDVIRQAHNLSATAGMAVDDEAKAHPNWVLPRHDAWMDLPEDQRQWTPQAVEFATGALRGDFKHSRLGRVSPSSMGDPCERLLLFAYAQAPKEPFPKMNAEKMAAGEFHHLRWQMEGLSAGYVNSGELWLHSETLKCGGSGDALLADGSLFELKSTASHLFKAITKKQGTAVFYGAAMHAKHLLQMEAYWLVDEVGSAERGEPRKLTDWGSLLYQDAGDPGQLFEYRLHSSPTRRAEVHRILEGLHEWIDLDELPDMLEGCSRTHRGEVVPERDAVIYARCPYRKHCPTAVGVTVR